MGKKRNDLKTRPVYGRYTDRQKGDEIAKNFEEITGIHGFIRAASNKKDYLCFQAMA